MPKKKICQHKRTHSIFPLKIYFIIRQILQQILSKK